MLGLEGTRSCARRTTCDEAVAASLPLAMYAGELAGYQGKPLGNSTVERKRVVHWSSKQFGRFPANPRGSARQGPAGAQEAGEKNSGSSHRSDVPFIRARRGWK